MKTQQTDVLVIGGAVVDVVYQPINPNCLTTAMHGTSTPCRPVRMSAGGVGRNIGEALGRLGVDVKLRTVVGGKKDQMTSGTNSANATVTADENGQTLLNTLSALERRYPNFKADPVIVSGSSRDDTTTTSASPADSSSAPPAKLNTANTATYMALLDGRGELTAAAAVMDIFEDHFCPEVAVGALPYPLGTTVLASSTTSVCSYDDSGSSNNNGVPSRASLPRWVVVDGNVPKRTLEAICERVAEINAALNHPANNPNNNITLSKRIRIAYDPISKEKVLKSLQCTQHITLMKPNIYEAIALGMAMIGEKQLGRRGNLQGIDAGATVANTAAAVSSSSSSSSSPSAAVLGKEAHHKAVVGVLAANVKAALHAWAKRGGYALSERQDSTVAEVANTITTTNTTATAITGTNPSPKGVYTTDGTFEGIVMLVMALARRVGGGSSKASSSTASALMWEVFEDHMTTSEQEALGLLAAMHLVGVGGVGTVLCTLGKGGCWRVTAASADGHHQTALNKKGSKDDSNANKAIAVTHIPSHPIPSKDLVKVTGAGDSFLSGYLYGLLTEEKMMKAPANGSTSSLPPAIAALPYPDRCAVLAASSALISRNGTINPRIREIVLGGLGENNKVTSKL